MKTSIKIILGLLILTFWFIPTSVLASQKAHGGIEFLNDVENVGWYKVNGEHIIIGWKGLPDNFYGWNYKAALKASKFSRNKIHVWAVRNNQKDWSPGYGGQICITTATKGRFEKTNCRK